MARHTAAWWQKRVEELSRVGDVEVVAKRYRVHWRTLRWWKTEFARRAREGVADGVSFVPVVVAPDPAQAIESPAHDATAVDVVVEIGRARVSLRGAVTVAHIEAIVRGLVGRC